MMDHSDIYNLQDLMTAKSNEDIPDPEDILRLWIWTIIWINVYTPWTLSKVNRDSSVWNKMDVL